MKMYKTRRLLIAVVTVLAVLFGASVMAQDAVTVYLVRHAEKDLQQAENPALTAQGWARAEQLAAMFKHMRIHAVYSTDTERTRSTAGPTAKANNVAVQLYSPGELNAADLRERHLGQNVLIVGHSNTIPKQVNQLLTNEVYADLSEQDYDSLFVVQLSEQSATSQHLYFPLAHPQP